ncbi:MAG: DUF433 domain-containing protein [Bacteroidetes bacterium]|nr:DUF433 domain-containing protein [Bacteroidota bacterium]
MLGKSIPKGSGISVEFILDFQEKEWVREQLLESNPGLSQEVISAVFAYVRECMAHELFSLPHMPIEF